MKGSRGMGKLTEARFLRAGPWMDWSAVVRMLKRQCNGNQAAWAKRHGVSAAYVNDVLKQRRLPGKKITKAMGLEEALLWRLPAGRAALKTGEK